MPRKSEPPERQCAVTREVQPVSALIRFVLDPQGEVVPDLKRVLPGRGVWITATKEVVAVAEKDRKKVFGRGFKGEASVEPGLADRVDALMERSVHASDAAEDGVRKLAALAAGTQEHANGCQIVRLFDSDQLDLALGRANVIHAALLAGQASENFLSRARDLERFRNSSGASSDNGNA